MKNVAQLLDGKGREVWSIGPEASVLEAVAAMAEHEIGALPVMEGERMVGVVSERDYARKVILKGRSSQSTKVSEIMTSDVVTTDPRQSVETCLGIMTDKRIRHLPVMEGDKLVGVLSIGDLVKAIIAEQQRLIEQLEQYIRG